MRIKRVEIIGFKSFCDRAVVQHRRVDHGRGRTERVRQVQHRRRDPLVHGRAERQAPARQGDGGRHLRGHRVARPGADGRGLADVRRRRLLARDARAGAAQRRGRDRARARGAWRPTTPRRRWRSRWRRWPPRRRWSPRRAPVAEAAPEPEAPRLWVDAEGNPIPSPHGGGRAACSRISRPRSTSRATPRSRSRGGSTATARRSTSSTRRRAGCATSPTSSSAPASAPRRTRSSSRAASARSSARARRIAARSSRRPPASRSSRPRRRRPRRSSIRRGRT